MVNQLDLNFLYYFVCETIIVLEVKINGLPEGTPPGKVYHWLCYDQASQQFQKLGFKSLGSRDNRDYREFEQGKLWFDASKAHLELQLTDEQKAFALTVQEPDTIPEDLVAKIQNYLQQLTH